MSPDFEKFNELLRYDKETGLLWWKQPKPGRQLGAPAGSKDKKDYIRIMINYRMYAAHRLAWLLYYGEWPKGVIDHIDRDCSNNKISNLRDTDHSTNMRNAKAKKDNKTGVRGISEHKGMYALRLQGVYIGSYVTIEAAIAAKEKLDGTDLRTTFDYRSSKKNKR